MPFRVVTACMACLSSLPPSEEQPRPVLIDGAREDDCYEFTCPHGHQQAMFLQMEKFELLFELGVAALLDHYPREAVTAFYASVERFYEWSVNVILTARASAIKFDAWKSAAGKQSERMIGAFHASWALEFGEVAPALPQELVRRRNLAVHEGQIPDESAAVEFGESVFEYVRPLMLRLRERHGDTAIPAVMLRRWPKGKGQLSSGSMPTFFGLHIVDSEYLGRSFRELLATRPLFRSL